MAAVCGALPTPGSRPLCCSGLGSVGRPAPSGAPGRRCAPALPALPQCSRTSGVAQGPELDQDRWPLIRSTRPPSGQLQPPAGTTQPLPVRWGDTGGCHEVLTKRRQQEVHHLRGKVLSEHLHPGDIGSGLSSRDYETGCCPERRLPFPGHRNPQTLGRSPGVMMGCVSGEQGR